MPAPPRIAAAILATASDDPLRLRALAMRVCAAPVERTAVVLGGAAAEPAFAPALHRLPLHLIANPQPSGVRAAVGWALRSGCDALLLVTCEHHHVTPAHLDHLLAAYRDSREVVASRCAHGMCLPAVFHATHYARLVHLTGDASAGVLLATTPGLVALDAPEPDLDLAA